MLVKYFIWSKCIFMENPQAELFSLYLQKACMPETEAPQFFILEGVQNFWPDHLLYDAIQHLLGKYFTSDFLFIRDFSKALAKEHSIKIKTDTNHPVYKTLVSEHNYIDMGMREINLRLQQSSFSWKKVLLIENIERMNTSALNAFLKTAEEPLAWTVILATTQNKSVLLDTILSRAILFSFAEKEDPIVIFNRLRDEHTALASIFEHAEQLFSSSSNIAEKHEKLKAIADAGIIIPFVDGLIALFTQSGKWGLAQKWLANKEILLGNVNTAQGLFYALVKLEEE